MSPETLSCYQRRLEGGYNLCDEKYMEWLKVNHPETFADLYNGNGKTDAVNLADAFCDIPVASPVAVELTADETENNEVEGEPREEKVN